MSRCTRSLFESRFTSEIDVKLRDKVRQAHGKLIRLAIWAWPDVVHSMSVLGRYVHNPSEKLWNAYHPRIAKYLRFETPKLQTSNLWISSSTVIPTPTRVAQLTTENLQAPMSYFC